MKRTIESIQPREVVWCKTPKEAEKFCKMLDDSGKKWCSGENYIENNKWKDYQDETCYNITLGKFAYINYYESLTLEYTITPATEFIEGEQESIIEETAMQKMSKLIEEYVDLKFSAPVQMKSIPHQLCPMCRGERNLISKSEKIPNDMIYSASVVVKCHICEGKGIIPQHVIE